MNSNRRRKSGWWCVDCGNDVICVQHSNRASEGKETDEYRIVQMTRENGKRQNEGEGDLRSIAAILR
jgi:hypothetical protein